MAIVPEKIRVAIVGAGPAGLVLALALAKRSEVSVTIFDRLPSHLAAETYNPDRSYTIDITGHGIRALKYIGSTARFDRVHAQCTRAHSHASPHGAKMSRRGFIARVHRTHNALVRCMQELIVFKGIYAVFVGRKLPSHGWTGSRGDICRALQREYLERAPDATRALRFDTQVTCQKNS